MQFGNKKEIACDIIYSPEKYKNTESENANSRLLNIIWIPSFGRNDMPYLFGITFSKVIFSLPATA
ncbi:MAG: hypothetical protein B1H05_05315 [Candidatus Cloacimonas sp. 4484_140]|nr:MAG: hypothetical protein B1H05_05315 [Candidatus Cloacimonas sp. 4484_140]